MEEMRDTSINVFSDDLDDNEDQTSHLDDEGLTYHLDVESILENFMKDMPSAWSFRRPTSRNNLWAFWNDSVTHSPTNTTNQGITDKIRYVLLHHHNGSLKYLGYVLIQFWAPITTETGCLQLVTSDQPFGLTDLHDGLLNYRKHCLEYKFNLDDHGEEEVEHLGIPGRVFCQKWPECTPDVRYYTSKEYPQLNFALTSDIWTSFAFPVFHTSFQDCVGVLEFVTYSDFENLKDKFSSFLRDALKVVNLKSFICENLSDSLHRCYPDPLVEINKGLRVVCATHKLPLAQTWAPCTHSVVSRQVLHLQSSAYYVRNDDNFQGFVEFCKQNDLQKGQGVVGRAYLSGKPCFCKDITQFSLTEYPLLPGARYFGLTNCFTICLQSTRKGKHNYILEFFLHSQIAYGKNPSTFLCSLLETMKQHFPSFKIPSGEEIGKELWIEIIKPNMNQQPTPSQCQNSRSPSGRGVLHNGQAMMQPHDDSYILKNFLKDIPNAVSFRRQMFAYKLWTFWCEPTLSPCTYHSLTDSVTHTPTTDQEITEKIKYALLYIDSDCADPVLIQFWASITTETGCFQLVTSDQPFALTHLNEKLLKYRKHCLEYKFNVDDHGKQHLGIPGLVFQRKWYEFNSDVRYYSTKEYPQRNFALTCDISASYAFPVFSTSFQDCVGVLEFVTNTNFKTFARTCNRFLMHALKKADLKGFFCDFIFDSAAKSGYGYDEIYKGLKAVCGTHKLPLAQMWAPCRCYNAPAYSYSCMGQVLHLQRSYVQDDNNLAEFLELCRRNDLQKGQGVVGRAYMSRKPCFCRDITQFSITEYPLLPSARHFQLTGCFAIPICLQSTCTREDFIREFFLHPETHGEDQSSFLGLVLETMRQHFPSYKLPSGEELGKELSIEFIIPAMNQEPTSFDCQITKSPPGPEVLHNGQETMQQHSSNQMAELDVLNKGRNVVNAEQNSIPVSCSGEARMNQEPASFQRQSMRSPPGPGVLDNGQEMMQQHSSNQQLIVDLDEINNGRNVVNAEQNSIPISCSDESNSITYEELKKHFGKKLEDVAQFFGVSRSTFKRKCRDNRILRWPQGKRNKVSSSLSRRHPPCSDLLGKKLVATSAHKTPLVTTSPKVRTITIKATHKDDMIKFQLPLSAKMVELEEEVSKRLKLNVGSYKIKYTDDDGDRVLIACDKDLQDCTSAFISLGMNTIKMFIEPIATPST